MSSHYLYIACEKCGKAESIYTGDVTTEDFDDADWEMETIEVPMCIECKDKSAPTKDTESMGGETNA